MFACVAQSLAKWLNAHQVPFFGHLLVIRSVI
jgi:hypothetical protein